MLHHYPEPGVDCRLTDSRRWWQALSAPELRIVISEDEIEVFQFQRQWLPGGRMQMLDHQRHALAGDGQAVIPSAATWQALHTILAPLAGQRWHVVVVLSNQYARWLVLPWQAQIQSQADKEAYYRHGLQLAFGGDMHDWPLRAQVTAYGQPTLINAMPGELIATLHAVLAEYRLSPGMILPAWTLSANQTLHMLRQRNLPLDGWVVCRESHTLTMACLMQGHWQQIHQLPVDIRWQHTLHQTLCREQVMHPERAALPVLLPQASLSGVSAQGLAPFTVVDVQPAQGLGEAFHQTLRRRVA